MLGPTIWHLLSDGALYEDPGADYFERRHNPAVEAKRLARGGSRHSGSKSPSLPRPHSSNPTPAVAIFGGRSAHASAIGNAEGAFHPSGSRVGGRATRSPCWTCGPGGGVAVTGKLSARCSRGIRLGGDEEGDE